MLSPAQLSEADNSQGSCVPSGEGGVDGDGDITRPENINAFRNFVLDNTDRKGVHFVMADGVGDCPCEGALWVLCVNLGALWMSCVNLGALGMLCVSLAWFGCCAGCQSLALGFLSACSAAEPPAPATVEKRFSFALQLTQ